MRNKRLVEQINQQQRDLTPSRDLWPGVANAIIHAEQSRENTNSRVGLLAAVVAGVLLLPLIWLMLPQPHSGGAETDLVTLLNTHHQQQKQLLVQSYADNQAQYRNANYAPETADVSADLERLRMASTALSEALYQDPDNRQLFDMLLWVQAEELELMKIELQSQTTNRWQQL